MGWSDSAGERALAGEDVGRDHGAAYMSAWLMHLSGASWLGRYGVRGLGHLMIPTPAH